ncbi:MAG: hypothetical protein ASARMPREDX12_004875 [Alectoria sarmentosa]|nr:MAG: hypothetical protein ASARMPREDX12_004875 [Alectoria sarmentosa]
MSSGFGRAGSPPRNRYAPPGRTSAGSFFSTSSNDTYPPSTRSSRDYPSGSRISAERVDAPRLPPLRTRSPPRRAAEDDYAIRSRPRGATVEAPRIRRPVSMVVPTSSARSSRPIITSAIERPPSPVTATRRDRRDDDYELLPASSSNRRHHQRHSSLGTTDSGRLMLEDRDTREKTYLSSNLSRPSVRERQDENDRDYGFEYTEAAREPRYQDPSYRQRSRRDSYNSGRPTSMIIPEGYIPRSNRESGPPVSTRGFENIGRSESLRQGYYAKNNDRALRDVGRDDREASYHPKVLRPEIALHQPSNDGYAPYSEEESRRRLRKPGLEEDKLELRPKSHKPAPEDETLDLSTKSRKIMPQDDALELRSKPRKVIREEERLEPRNRDLRDDDFEQSRPKPRKAILDEERLEARIRDPRDDEHDQSRPQPRKVILDEERPEPRTRDPRDDDHERDRDDRSRKHRHRRHHRDHDHRRDYDDRDDRNPRARDDPRDKPDRAEDRGPSNGLLAGAGAAAAATGLAAEGVRRHRNKESRDEEGLSAKQPQDHLREPERDHLDTSSVSSGLSGDTQENKEERKRRKRLEKEEEDHLYEEARAEERRAKVNAELFVGPVEPVLREQASYERRPEDRAPRHHRSYTPRRHHSSTRDDDSYTESSFSSSSDSEDHRIERQPRVVTPSNEEKPVPPPAPKGILRKPREKFPEHPDTIREGVAPHKEMPKKDVPPNARWTKINRKLVNPEALEQDGIRFNEYVDHVIVLKAMDLEEIEKYTRKTAEIREKRRLLMGPEPPKPVEPF